MSEIIPPDEPEEKKPTPIAKKSDSLNSPPSFGLMFALGIVLVVISALLCIPFQSPTPFIWGAIGAFISLFFEGYRGIFVGYILSIGLALLSVIIYCANHPFNV